MAQGAGKFEPKAVPLSGAVIAVLIALAAGFVFGRVIAGPGGKRGGGKGSAGPTPVAKVDADKFAKAVREGNPPRKGPDSAPVKVVLFSDFMCGYCGRIAPSFAKLAQQFGDKVQLVYRTFPLDMHPGADLSAEAALAANEQGKFWEYHDILFDKMDRQSRNDLEGYARQLGLDIERFRKALDDRTFRSEVELAKSLGRSMGVTGTPTLIINGQMVVGPNPAQLAGMVDRASKGKPIVDESAAAAPEGQQARAPQPPPPLPPASEAKDVKIETWNPSEGPANAPITIVSYCEYMCPFCKKIQPTLRMIREKFGDKVRIVYRNLIIHGEKAEIPALAALAAQRQGKFEALHALMFEHQGELSQGRGRIEELAQQAGLDMARFRADMDSPETRAQLEADKAEGARIGASSTPSSYVNGRYMRGARPPSNFGKWIDELLGNQGTTIPASLDPQEAARGGQAGCGS
jgi:protein-disulfide isomerase